MNLSGFLLIRDKAFSFEKDVISLVDRILEGKLFDKVRGKDLRGRDLNELLQIVRSNTMEITEWKKTLDPDKIPTAFVMAGLDELRGGASHYWNEKHQRNMMVELEGLGFDVVFITPVVNKGLNIAQSSWLQRYSDRCAGFTSCDTISFSMQKRDPQGREIEALSRTMADHLTVKLGTEGKVRKLFIANASSPSLPQKAKPPAPARKIRREHIRAEAVDVSAVSSLQVEEIGKPKGPMPKRPTIFEKRKRLSKKKKEEKRKQAQAVAEAVAPVVEVPVVVEVPPPETTQVVEEAPKKRKAKRRGRKADLPKIEYTNGIIASY